MNLALEQATTSTAAATFTAHRHHEDGCWWADSPQAPGWTAASGTPEALLQLVTEAPSAVLGWPAGYSTVLLHTDRPLEV